MQLNLKILTEKRLPLKNKFKNLKIMPKKTSKLKKNSLKPNQTFTESKTLRRACTMKT